MKMLKVVEVKPTASRGIAVVTVEDDGGKRTEVRCSSFFAAELQRLMEDEPRPDPTPSPAA